MEKIKLNKLRCIVLFISIAMVIEIIFLLINKSPRLRDFPVFSIMIFSIWLFVVYMEKKKKGIFYSKEKVFIINDKKEVTEILWDDVVIDSSLFQYWAIGLTACKLKSKTNPNINEQIYLDWFYETSALPMIKKYAPRNNDLYHITKKYADKRGLGF